MQIINSGTDPLEDLTSKSAKKIFYGLCVSKHLGYFKRSATFDVIHSFYLEWDKDRTWFRLENK